MRKRIRCGLRHVVACKLLDPLIHFLYADSHTVPELIIGLKGTVWDTVTACKEESVIYRSMVKTLDLAAVEPAKLGQVLACFLGDAAFLAL